VPAVVRVSPDMPAAAFEELDKLPRRYASEYGEDDPERPGWRVLAEPQTMLAPLRRLHGPQRICRLSSVLPPPTDTGMMWSN
jgi:hypothetical protein